MHGYRGTNKSANKNNLFGRKKFGKFIQNYKYVCVATYIASYSGTAVYCQYNNSYIIFSVSLDNYTRIACY